MSLFKSKSERETIKQAKIEKLEVKIAEADKIVAERNAKRTKDEAERRDKRTKDEAERRDKRARRNAEIDAKTQAKKDRLDAEIAQLNKERKELLALRKKKK